MHPVCSHYRRNRKTSTRILRRLHELRAISRHGYACGGRRLISVDEGRLMLKVKPKVMVRLLVLNGIVWKGD